MPMWSDLDRRPEALTFAPASRRSPPLPLSRQLSEESIRTELCDGPILVDSPEKENAKSSELPDSDSESRAPLRASDRQELIQRLKRAQGPPRIPTSYKDNLEEVKPPPDARPEFIRHSQPLLLPAIELKNIGSSSRDGPSTSSSEARLSNGYEIARPKSALHAGDFTETEPKSDLDFKPVLRCSNYVGKETIDGPLGTCPTTPHYTPSHSRRASLRITSHTEVQAIPIGGNPRPNRSRAPSLQSYSSSFILKAPTSPLVQQANNDDFDFSPSESNLSFNKENRRHTLPPHSLQSLKSFNSGSAQAARQPYSIQREESYPQRKGHQYRRSLGSGFPVLGSVSPPGSIYGFSHRPSVSSEASPRQHASMVGSYEESILRGRMSATPSKPLEFTAQIGALGKGDCKYKHPAHVSIQFPAVFYNWSSTNNDPRTPSLDEPSPYVGQIDLEHNLPPPKRKEKSSRRRENVAYQLDGQDAPSESPSRQATAHRKLDRRRRQSRSPSPMKLLPVGGSYRIPQEGHLQILIKNPNKTAVKLFLVPYDLHGMEAGTKTFIRQKCYSTGPIIEKPITSKPMSASAPASDSIPPVLGNATTTTTSSIATTTTTTPIDPKSKPTLRYLIHLQICCPSKGRFYLHKSISVVFANRVPDNKESLKNEIRLPEPRYSPYKLCNNNGMRTNISHSRNGSIDTATGLSSFAATAADACQAIEHQQRRRSYGFGGALGAAGEASDATPVLHSSVSSLEGGPVALSFPFTTPEQTPVRRSQAGAMAAATDPVSPLQIPPPALGIGLGNADVDMPYPEALQPIVTVPHGGCSLDENMDVDRSLSLSPVLRRPLLRDGSFSYSRPGSSHSGGGIDSGREGGAVGGRVLSPVLSDSVKSTSSMESSDSSYGKLSRSDLGYGGIFGRPGTPEPGEGLLARRLRGLDVEVKIEGAGAGIKK